MPSQHTKAGNNSVTFTRGLWEFKIVFMQVLGSYQGKRRATKLKVIIRNVFSMTHINLVFTFYQHTHHGNARFVTTNVWNRKSPLSCDICFSFGFLVSVNTLWFEKISSVLGMKEEKESYWHTDTGLMSYYRRSQQEINTAWCLYLQIYLRYLKYSNYYSQRQGYIKSKSVYWLHR